VKTGLEITFELLSATENEAAVDALLPALNSPHEKIQEGAVRTLLDRRSLAGQRELIRTWPQAIQRWPELLDAQRGRMSPALREAVLGDDPTLFAHACQALLWLREYDLLSALLSVLEDDSNPRCRDAANTALELVDLLYQELASPRDYRSRRDPQLVRRHLTSTLEESVARYARHRKKEVLESLLVLSPRDSAALKQLLHDPFHSAYLDMVDVLLHSERGGVLRLLLGYLEDPHPPTAALSALARRQDLRFIRHLLKKIGYEPSAAAAANLKKLEAIPWLQSQFELLNDLDDAAQHSAVKMLMASGIKRLEAFHVIEHLAIHGTPGGRRAACEALAQFQGLEASSLTLRALEDPDPFVQAAGARQLRQRGIPGALPKLLELLESRYEVVRNAVRESLAEFQFKRFLSAYDSLDPEVRGSTAALVRKVDPECLPLLVEEMQSSVRSRRMRGIEIAVAMHAVRDVESALIGLTSDEDHHVRAEAARALGQSNSPQAQQALLDLMSDRSHVVQEAARQGLSEQSLRSRFPTLPSSGPIGGGMPVYE
jgi:HEAT repeat protein